MGGGIQGLKNVLVTIEIPNRTRPERGLQLRKKGLKGFDRYFGLNESTGLLLAYGMEHRADRL